MDEWYLIRSDDHDMDKDLVITAEILDAVMDMASVMVTCRISVQDPMKNLGWDWVWRDLGLMGLGLGTRA